MSDSASTAALEAAAKSLFEGHQGARLSPYLLGLIADGFMQGIILCQFVTWCDKSYRTERRVIRFLAVWVVLVGLAYSFLQATRAIRMFAINYGSYLALVDETLARWMIMLLYITHWSVEAFYIERAFLLSNRNRVLLVCLSTLLCGVIGIGIASIVCFPALGLTWTMHEFNLFTAAASAIAGTDIIITCTIIFLLWKRRTGQSSGNRLVTRLVLLSAETQLPPSIIAIIICAFDGDQNIYPSPVLVTIMCKMTIMTLFVVLNSRRTIRAEYVPKTIARPPIKQTRPGVDDVVREVDPPTNLAVLDYEPSSNARSMAEVSLTLTPSRQTKDLPGFKSTAPSDDDHEKANEGRRERVERSMV